MVSELGPEAPTAIYHYWFRAKVKEALDDPRPSMFSDEAVARMDTLLAEKRKMRAVG